MGGSLELLNSICRRTLRTIERRMNDATPAATTTPVEVFAVMSAMGPAIAPRRPIARYKMVIDGRERAYTVETRFGGSMEAWSWNCRVGLSSPRFLSNLVVTTQEHTDTQTRRPARKLASRSPPSAASLTPSIWPPYEALSRARTTMIIMCLHKRSEKAIGTLRRAAISDAHYRSKKLRRYVSRHASRPFLVHARPPTHAPYLISSSSGEG